LISTQKDLALFLTSLNRAPWVAMDTEGDSLHAYPERLCLLQLSIPELDVLIDPLAGLDLTPLWTALSQRELLLHGADFDLRLLRKSTGFVPQTVFDTMLAARLIGEQHFSLQALLETYLGVHLGKELRKENWALRPLPPQMAAYGKNDTRYLKPLADRLHDKLRDLHRLEWHQEWCARLVETCSVERLVDPERVWRLKGSQRLNPRGLAVLRELWRWREREALSANRPPYFILSHERLVGLAAASERFSAHELRLPPSLSPARKAGLRAAVQHALNSPAASWPAPMCRRPCPPEQRHQKSDSDELYQWRDEQAARFNIDPTLIANREQIEGLSRNWDKHIGELMSWQQELLSQPPRKPRT
jgi:ribonuclease D